MLFLFLIKNDVDLLIEWGFLKNDKNWRGIHFEIIIIEHKEDYLAYIENEEESILEDKLDKKWKAILQQWLEMLDMNVR